MNEDNLKTPDNSSFKEKGISLKEFLNGTKYWYKYLLKKWIIVGIGVILGAVIGLVYSYYSSPVYTAKLTFVLTGEQGKGLGNLGGLAAIAGINIGGDIGLFQENNIIDLYKSQLMLNQTLLSTSKDNDSLLIERYISFKGLKKTWADNPLLKNISFDIPREKYVLQHDSVLATVVKDINERYLRVSKLNKLSNMIEVEMNSTNELFAKDFTGNLVKKVNEFFIETQTKKSTNNLKILQVQTDSIRKELNSAIGGVAVSIDANPNANPARQVLNVPSTKRQVDVQTNQIILSELVKNLEVTKMSLRNETPLIQVVDEPILPLEVNEFGWKKGIVFGGFLAGFLIISFLILKKIIKDTLNED